MRKLVWGIIILAVVALLLTLWGPWNAKAHSAQMGNSIETALAASNLDFAKVDMSGNVATLSGNAPSQALADSAVQKAASTECKTCRKTGQIWHEVKSDLNVAQQVATPKRSLPTAISPYRFSATKTAGGPVDLTGYVGSEEDRSRISAEANALFGDNLRANKIGVAPGAPNANWADVVSLHMPKLASLDSGKFSLNGSQALLTGTVSDASIRNDVNAIVSQLPDSYIGAANITVPNAAALNAGQVQSAVLCQSLFNDLKGKKRINFASGNAQLRGAQTYDLLNALASAAQQCQSFNILIEGHTDTQGQDEANQFLSEQRALEVAGYLAQNEVARSRMTVKGFGETQPIASNDTEEGRAANRRINFVVTPSE